MEPVGVGGAPRSGTRRALLPERIATVARAGRAWYVFPDPNPDGCNCLYVGDADQFAEAKRIARERELADGGWEVDVVDDDGTWEVWGPWGW